VRALVGHVAAGIIPKVPPGAEPHRLEIAIFRGAKKPLPIEFPGQRRVVQRSRHVPVPHRLHHGDFAEDAAIDHFLRFDDSGRAAPLHADLRTNKIDYTNSYYYIGHFSKFIHPGAKRIVSSSNRTDLLTTAFKNEDGKVIVVVMNKGDKKIPYRLWIGGKAAEITGLPHSIATLVL